MKIAVIGGGTAGLMAAVIASEKHNVTLYERQGRVGKKLYASGNGKCNLTNTALTRENLAANDGFYNCREAKDIVSIFPILSLAAIAKADESIPPDNKNAFAPLIPAADATTSLNVAENTSYASSKETKRFLSPDKIESRSILKLPSFKDILKFLGICLI